MGKGYGRNGRDRSNRYKAVNAFGNLQRQGSIHLRLSWRDEWLLSRACEVSGLSTSQVISSLIEDAFGNACPKPALPDGPDKLRYHTLCLFADLQAGQRLMRDLKRAIESGTVSASLLEELDFRIGKHRYDRLTPVPGRCFKQSCLEYWEVRRVMEDRGYKPKPHDPQPKQKPLV